MSLDSIIPSKYFSVHGDTTVEECLSLMNQKSTSFLLVKNDDGVFEGIFTLKDLLKYFSFLRQTEYLERPVRTVMNRPLICLPVEKIHQAADLMYQKKIRHLPIVVDVEVRKRVVGVVDIDAILKSFMNEGHENRTKQMSLGVISPDGVLIHALKSTFKYYENVMIEKVWLSKLGNEVLVEQVSEEHEILLCDLIDETKFPKIKDLIEHFEEQKKRVFCFVFRKSNQSDEMEDFISEINSFKCVSVYEKPINFQDLITHCLDE